MRAHRVIDLPHDGLPGSTAIVGAKRQAVRANNQAVPGIDELQGEKRFVCRLTGKPFSRLHARGGGIRIARRKPLPGGGRQLKLCRTQTVQLHSPVFTTVAGCQHDAAMPHGPACVGVDKLHGGQADRNRHRCLTPTHAVVIRKQHDAPLPHRHQPRTRPGQVQQHRGFRLRRQHRRRVECVAHRSGLRQAQRRQRQRHQPHQPTNHLTESVHTDLEKPFDTGSRCASRDPV
ncbi:hypothetical protein D3C87_1315930 [compost metagenome]